MDYTLAGAAKAVGVGKTTIHTAIKRGRLSASRAADGSYRIDGAELARVYPPVPTERSEPSPWNNAEHAGTAPEGPGTAGDPVELAVLKVRLEAAETALERSERERASILETVDDLRKRLDQEQEERRTLQRQLAAPIQPPPQAAQELPPEPPAAAEELRRRLEEAEALVRTLATVAQQAPQAAEAWPGAAPAPLDPAKAVRGLLGRLLGR